VLVDGRMKQDRRQLIKVSSQQIFKAQLQLSPSA
jgi:hypothetical protein